MTGCNSANPRFDALRDEPPGIRRFFIIRGSCFWFRYTKRIANNSSHSRNCNFRRRPCHERVTNLSLTWRYSPDASVSERPKDRSLRSRRALMRRAHTPPGKPTLSRHVAIPQYLCCFPRSRYSNAFGFFGGLSGAGEVTVARN